jgi:hypothetical protein
MKLELWCKDSLPQISEGINNDGVCLVECKGHFFNHGLNNINLDYQLKQTVEHPNCNLIKS